MKEGSMDFRKSKLEERYERDASFAALVQQIERAIILNGFTPSELREALFLAHYKYEMENPNVINNRIMLRMSGFWENKK